MLERVAVTGVGAVSALGHGARATFEALVDGARGFGPVTLFDAADARARIAAEVRGLDVRAIAPRDEADDFSRTDALALAAAREALGAAGAPRVPFGVSLGGTTGGMLETEQFLLAGPLDRIDASRAARLLSHPLDLTTDRVARALGGASLRSTLCAACSSSALAIVQGAAWLLEGRVDLVLAGGADGLCRLTFFGFDALGALDVTPCRPFDRERQGLGLGEGAAFLCLERESAALARGAEILAVLSGTATGADAHHITHPEPSGARAAELLGRALAAAGLAAGDLDYVNAHGTGTQQNDAMEARALHRALGDQASRVLVSSAKGQLGHTLGAAGALEAVVTVLALKAQIAPATAGLETPEDPTLGHVLGGARRVPLRAAASCSFGFGGTGAVLVLESPDAPLRERPERGSARVVVTGLAALGAFGEVGPRGAGRALERAPLTATARLEPQPLAELDPERSRRFDPSAALVTRLAERALAHAELAPAGVGLSAGTAFGAVERSVRFVLRVAARGVRRANPAEFPHLVASAASGNASIYLGLTGPAFGVAGGGGSADAAVAAAASWLRLGDARAFVAGAAEGFDPIVAEVLGDRETAEGMLSRSEGGGFLVLEAERVARERRAPILALLRGSWELGRGSGWPVPPPERGSRAVVIATCLSGALASELTASPWGRSTRRSVLPATGFHEAVSGVALATAAALVAAGAADEVLTVTQAEHAAWATLFSRPEVAG